MTFLPEKHHPLTLYVVAMFSTIIGLILLLAVILIIGMVVKAIKIAISLAVIVGIVALILHFTKKKG